MEFVESSLRADEKRGQLNKGRSEWGFPAFATKPGPRKRRVVIAYRRLSAITVCAVFIIPRAEDI